MSLSKKRLSVPPTNHRVVHAARVPPFWVVALECVVCSVPGERYVLGAFSYFVDHLIESFEQRIGLDLERSQLCRQGRRS